MLTGIHASVYGQTTTWNGTENSDWFNPANWSDGVPGENTTAEFGNIGGNQSEPVLDGAATIGGLSVANNSTFTLSDNADLTILGDVAIPNNGRFDVANGSVTIDHPFETSGTLTLDNGTIQFHDDVELTGRGELTVQTGTINVGDPGPPVISAEFTMSGNTTFNLNNGTINFYGESMFDGNGELNVEDGEVNFFDRSTFKGGGDVNAGSGSFYFGDDVTFAGGGNFNAESSTIEMDDVSVLNEGGGTFDPGTSTVIMTGDNDISGQDLDFYNLIIEEDASLTVTGAYVNVLNDYTAMGGSEVYEESDGILNVDGDSTVISGRIFYSRETGDWSDQQSWARNDHDGPLLDDRLPGSSEGDGDDIVYIGAGHTISISDARSLKNIIELSVAEESRLTVTGTGELELSAGRFVHGSGTFELSDGGRLIIASPDGISNADDTGPVQTATRLFAAGADYTYRSDEAQITGDGLPSEIRNLTIDSSEGVTLHQSTQITENLLLSDGILTVGDGFSLIAQSEEIQNGSLRYLLSIDGNPGYRMISAPLDTDFSGFLNGIPTQGVAGSSLPENLQPNIMWYDESYRGTDNQRWRAPVSMSDDVEPGRGYHVYLFGDLPEDDRYNEPFPLTLEVTGQPHDTPNNEIELDVTFTAEADSGWNMVGNPYGAAIDWNHSSWTKTNIDETIYVWDANSNQYHTWNGITGDIPNGIIAPFQAFWVKANDENPELSVHRDARTVGGSFIGANSTVAHPAISITAHSSDRFRSTAHFSFTEDASYGMDNRDALRLQPPPGISDYIEIFSRNSEGKPLAINNLPRRFGKTIEIPFELNAWREGQPAEEDLYLEISAFDHIPSWWDVQIINEQTGERIPVSGRDSTQISISHLNKTASSESHESGYRVVTAGKDSHAQFTLRIGPGRDAEEIPSDFSMKQNYPNPFNPTTTIQFELPLQSDVRLEVYDITGRRVATLIDETLQAGSHERIWDASNLASGVYIARLITPEQTFVRKLTLIK